MCSISVFVALQILIFQVCFDKTTYPEQSLLNFGLGRLQEPAITISFDQTITLDLLNDLHNINNAADGIHVSFEENGFNLFVRSKPNLI